MVRCPPLDVPRTIYQLEAMAGDRHTSLQTARRSGARDRERVCVTGPLCMVAATAVTTRRPEPRGPGAEHSPLSPHAPSNRVSRKDCSVEHLYSGSM